MHTLASASTRSEEEREERSQNFNLKWVSIVVRLLSFFFHCTGFMKFFSHSLLPFTFTKFTVSLGPRELFLYNYKCPISFLLFIKFFHLFFVEKFTSLSTIYIIYGTPCRDTIATVTRTHELQTYRLVIT
jgi:hypothetical protein